MFAPETKGWEERIVIEKKPPKNVYISSGCRDAKKKKKNLSPSLYIQGSNYLKKLKTENKAVWENAWHPEGEEKSWEVIEAERDMKGEEGAAFSIIPI